MSDSNLSVKITADIVDLQVKFAQAKAEASGLSAELNKLARASNAGSLDAGGSARMEQLAGDMLHARAEAAGLAEQLQAAGVSVGGFGSRIEGAHEGIATTARELHKLFSEAREGNMGGVEVTVLRLAQGLIGLGPAGLIALGAVTAITAGLGYLVVRSIETANALDKIKIRADLAGNLDITRAGVQALADQMSQSAEISNKQALAIAGAITSIPYLAEPARAGLAEFAQTLTDQFGVASDKVAEDLQKMFSPDTSATKFTAELREMGAALTESQRQAAAAADLTGDANQQAAAKMRIANEVAASGKNDWIAHASAVTSSFGNLMAYVGLVKAGLPADEIMVRTATEQWEKHTQAIEASARATASIPQSPELSLGKGMDVANSVDTVTNQVAKASEKIRDMTSALAEAQRRGDQVSVQHLVESLQKVQSETSALQLGPVLDRMREQMEQVAATWDGTQSGMLAKQIQIAGQTLASVKGNAAQTIDVEKQIAQLRVQYQRAAADEIIAAVHAQNSAIEADTSLSAVQRREVELENLLATLGNAQLTGQKRIAVEQEVNSATVALAKERAAEQDAIERSNVDATISISKMQIEAQKQVLTEDLANHTVNAAQKLQVLRNLTIQEEQLDEQALQTQLGHLQEGTAAYAEVYKKIRELKAKLTVDLAGLDRQAAEDAKRAAQEEMQAWRKAVDEIEGAESTMIGDLLSKRKSFSQAAIQMAGQLATQEIENDVRAITTRLLLSNTAEAQQKALEQGGLIYHEAIELEKTSATGAGTAARTADNQAANSGFLALLPQQLAKWLGLETTKTAQTTAATTERTATQDSADATTVAATVVTGEQQIQAAAAVAAALAGASVAAIPYAGWAMVPEVQATTYASTMAYAGGLEVGAWNIPDTMMATLHKGESVVPRDFASGMRASGMLNGGSGGNTYGDFHQHNHIDASGMSEDRLMSVLQKKARNFHPAFMGAK